jgi:molecular chaperone GrpE (heat shock protein)
MPQMMDEQADSTGSRAVTPTQNVDSPADLLEIALAEARNFNFSIKQAIQDFDQILRIHREEALNAIKLAKQQSIKEIYEVKDAALEALKTTSDHRRAGYAPSVPSRPGSPAYDPY